MPFSAAEVSHLLSERLTRPYMQQATYGIPYDLLAQARALRNAGIAWRSDAFPRESHVLLLPSTAVMLLLFDIREQGA